MGLVVAVFAQEDAGPTVTLPPRGFGHPLGRKLAKESTWEGRYALLIKALAQ